MEDTKTLARRQGSDRKEEDMSGWKCGVVMVVLLLSVSCAADRSQRRPFLIKENLAYAAEHAQRNESEEAAQIYQIVLLADPDNAEATAALDKIGYYERTILQPSLLGKNYISAPKRDRNALWMLMWPVNRVLDLLDCVSFHVGLEGGVFVDAHVTRAAQLGGGTGGGTQVGWWQKRDAGFGSGHVFGLAAGPLSVDGEGYTRFGTAGVSNASFSTTGINRPSDPAYQKHRDYWGIGTRVIAVIVGVGVEFHPVELADFAAGFVFVDFLRDDIGRTRPLKLTRPEKEAIEDLLHTLSDAQLRARMRGQPLEDVKDDEVEQAP